MSEKWHFFWCHWKNHFSVSASFAYFFSNWPSQGATPGQIWSQQFHLAGNPGSFFLPAIWKSSLFIDIVRLYMHRIFLFFWVFLPRKFKFFGQKGLQTYKSTTSSMLLLRSCVFLLFLSFIMKCFVLYTFEIFKKIKVLKKIGCGLQNAHLQLYDVIIALIE